MKTSYSASSKPASVDSMMTPMIDVVFLLLVFFLATSSFQRMEKALPSAMATAPDSKRQGSGNAADPPKALTDLSDVVVRIQRPKDATTLSMEYSINGEPVGSLEILASRMDRILRVRADVPIVIDPSDDVPAGEAIRVYDLAKANGSVAVFLVAR